MNRLSLLLAGWLLLGPAILPMNADAAEPPQLEPMSLDLEEMDLGSLLQTFAKVAQSRLVKAPGLQGAITFRFDDVSWETALTAICESAGCTWRIEEGTERVLRVRRAADTDDNDDRVSLRLNQAAAGEVFALIAEIQGHESEIDPDIDGKVTIEFSNVRFDTILDALCQGLECRWSRTDRPPTTLQVARLPKGSKQQQPSTPRAHLENEIDIDLEGATVNQVLDHLARVLGVEPRLPEELHGEVSLTLTGTPVREALDAVCDPLFLRWSLTRGPGDRWALVVRRLQGDFEPPGFLEEQRRQQ